MQKKRSHGTTKEWKNQATDWKQQEILLIFKNKKHTFLFFVNEKREEYKCDFSMIKQAVKQVNRVSKLDQSLQNQIWQFWGEKLQKTFWN